MAPIALILSLFSKKEATSEKIFVPLHMVWSVFVKLFLTPQSYKKSLKQGNLQAFFFVRNQDFLLPKLKLYFKSNGLKLGKLSLNSLIELPVLIIFWFESPNKEMLLPTFGMKRLR